MADDSWYGQLARWIIGGGGIFFAGFAIGSISALGICKYKQRKQEKVKQKIPRKEQKTKEDTELERVVVDEEVEPSVESTNLGNGHAVVQDSTTQTVNIPSSSHQTEVDTYVTQESIKIDVNDPTTVIYKRMKCHTPTIVSGGPGHSSEFMDKARIKSSEAFRENQREQNVEPVKSGPAEGVDGSEDAAKVEKELAEAAEDLVASTLQTSKPADSVFKFS